MDLPDLTAGQTLMAGGLVTGLLLAGWTRIKAVAARLFSLLVVKVEYHGYAQQAVTRWLFESGHRLPGGARWYLGCIEYLRPKRRMRPVLYETLSNESACWIVRGRPIWVGVKAIPLETRSGSSDHDNSRIEVYFFRGMFDPDRLGFDAVERFSDAAEFAGGGRRDRATRRYEVIVCTGSPRATAGALTYGDSSSDPGKSSAAPSARIDASNRLVGYAWEDVGQPVEAAPFLGLYYPPEVHAAVTELERWKKSEDWYRRKGIPWRRAWLLAGAPGSGKSRLIRAVAQHHDLPIYLFDLATMDNRELDRFWNRALAAAPCLAVFEDLDGVFRGRENVLGDRSDLTFDKFLQCLSGVASSDGVFVVVTTNHPDSLDPAIGRPEADGESGRPGRIDRVIELGPPDDTCRRQILADILDDCAAPGEVDDLTEALRGKTAAQVAEHAARLALRRHWESPENLVAVPPAT